MLQHRSVQTEYPDYQKTENGTYARLLCIIQDFLHRLEQKRERTQLMQGLVDIIILAVLNVSAVRQRRRENNTSNSSF